MRIVVYDNSGHPFQVELSRFLAKNGYEVLHIYSASFQTPKGTLMILPDDPKCFNVKGLKLRSEFKKYSFYKRWKQEKEFGKLVIEELDKFLPDIIITSNVPLDTLKYISNYCKFNNIPLIFWVQDIYGIAIKKILSKRLGLLGVLIGNYYIRLEKKILNKSSYIILIASEFVQALQQIAVVNMKYSVIPNWAPLNELSVVPKNNKWAIKYNLVDKFCFLYSGTLGLKHKPELLIELCEEFKYDTNVIIVVVSEGKGAEWLKNKIKEDKLENIIVLAFQDFSDLSNVMGTADVLISVLEEEAGIYSVPSKVLSYHCAGRAMLLAVPKENLSAKIVTTINSGLVINPKDNKGFRLAARKLYNDDEIRTLMGCNARKYAEENFNILKIGDNFIQIINKVLRSSNG